ncbi:MAG: zinc-finger domain-containing protein [Pseudomonadota bacterium]|nr:zinc-finger domain-containing protein [Pseudomonadota bacterium]
MKNACSSKKVIITEDDLPLSCPMPNQKIANAHPKVFLPIDRSKSTICKYCSTEYILE